MDFQITNAGDGAITAFGASGPQIAVTKFKLTNQAGYVPDGTETSLPGVQVYEGAIVGYNAVSQNEGVFLIEMDATIGTFAFATVGLFIEDYPTVGQETLFALQSMPDLQTKYGTLSGNANKVVIEAHIAHASITPAIYFPVATPAALDVIQLANINLLPRPEFADSDIYLTHANDDAGNPIMVVRDDDLMWSFSTHKTTWFQGIGDTITATSVTCSTLTAATLSDFATGRFLLQFDSYSGTGTDHRGHPRRIASVSGTTISLDGSWVNPPQNGTTFKIYASDAYVMQQGGALTEYTSVDALPKAGSLNRAYRVSRSFPSLTSGKNVFTVTSTEDSGNGEWIPSEHQLVWDVNNLKLVSGAAVPGQPTWGTSTTEVVIAVSLTVPAESAVIPSYRQNLVATFFDSSDTDNQGLAREITAVTTHTSGGTEYIRLQFGTALPAVPVSAQKFKLWYPQRIGGGGGGSSLANGQYAVESFTADANAFTSGVTINTVAVDCNYSSVYVQSGYQAPTRYTIVGPQQITFAAGQINPGEAIDIVEITAAPVATSYVGEHGSVKLRITASNQIVLMPCCGNALFIAGETRGIPSLTTYNTGALLANTLYYVYAYLVGSTITLEAVTTAPNYNVTSTYGVVTKTGEASRTLVGLWYKNTTASKANYFNMANYYIRSFYNDCGTVVYGTNQLSAYWLNGAGVSSALLETRNTAVLRADQAEVSGNIASTTFGNVNAWKATNSDLLIGALLFDNEVISVDASLGYSHGEGDKWYGIRYVKQLGATYNEAYVIDSTRSHTYASSGVGSSNSGKHVFHCDFRSPGPGFYMFDAYSSGANIEGLAYSATTNTWESRSNVSIKYDANNKLLKLVS